MPLPAPQALAALAGTPAGWGHHTSKTVICPHTSAQTVQRLAMSPGSWETFSVGWLQKCIFSLSTWLRTIYCLQTIHEPACVILTLFQFFYISNQINELVSLTVSNPALSTLDSISSLPSLGCFFFCWSKTYNLQVHLQWSREIFLLALYCCSIWT